MIHSVAMQSGAGTRYMLQFAVSKQCDVEQEKEKSVSRVQDSFGHGEFVLHGFVRAMHDFKI